MASVKLGVLHGFPVCWFWSLMAFASGWLLEGTPSNRIHAAEKMIARCARWNQQLEGSQLQPRHLPSPRALLPTHACQYLPPAHPAATHLPASAASPLSAAQAPVTFVPPLLASLWAWWAALTLVSYAGAPSPPPWTFDIHELWASRTSLWVFHWFDIVQNPEFMSVYQELPLEWFDSCACGLDRTIQQSSFQYFLILSGTKLDRELASTLGLTRVVRCSLASCSRRRSFRAIWCIWDPLCILWRWAHSSCIFVRCAEVALLSVAGALVHHVRWAQFSHPGDHSFLYCPKTYLCLSK